MTTNEIPDLEARIYTVTLTETAPDGTCRTALTFGLRGHHDIAALAAMLEQTQAMEPKHAAQLALGLRLMHHALKKYPAKQLFADFLHRLNDFKHAIHAPRS